MLGYGHNGLFEYGKGAPPMGWPENIAWDKFRGPHHSKGYDKEDLHAIIEGFLSALEEERTLGMCNLSFHIIFYCVFLCVRV